ncbi:MULTISPECIES: hypothetical protein [Enterobacterales]|jgi:hypothetical protein|uniref:Uncharacterized protein n=1 Tax=Candidatus Pantoea communis TaxID=2608354 RepID=A0ABX0RXQ0_9GAMM|nr:MULTISPECIES: hypothetical protein [Enterobacterales]KGT86779.1 hypothetical protein NH00_24640 [Enterobacter cancerogenus]MXP61357.1 hypothetical protein [Pantoea sp. Taur]NIG22370.1 hypothetical protein [Pantoea communis]
MKDEKYFENLHSRVIGVLGGSLMCILEEQKELTKDSLIEVVKQNFAGDDYHLAVDVVLDLLRQHNS